MAETKTEADAPIAESAAAVATLTLAPGAAPVQPVTSWWDELPPLVALSDATATAVVLLVELVPGGRAVWSCSEDLFESEPADVPWRERAAVSFDRVRGWLPNAGGNEHLVPTINCGWVESHVSGDIVRIADHFQEDPTGLELTAHIFDVPRERYARILEECARILRAVAAAETAPSSPA